MKRERLRGTLDVFRRSHLIRFVPTTGALGLAGTASSEIRQAPEARVSVPRVHKSGKTAA